MEAYYEHIEQRILDSDWSAEKKQVKLEQLEKGKQNYEQPVFKMGMTFLEIFPVGLLVSIISALLLRRKKT